MENKELNEFTRLNEYVKTVMREQVSMLRKILEAVNHHKPFTKEQEAAVIVMQTHLSDCIETLSLWEGMDDLIERPININ